MKPLRTFYVEPNLPERVKILKELAYNLRWTWDSPTRDLFRRLDADLWEKTRGNPVQMLGEVDPGRFHTLLEDESFLYHLDTQAAELKEYMSGENSWFAKTYPDVQGPLAAYFSAEFGVTDAIPLFCGGLGVLAGDHLKSASDMGVPIVGVGLAYQQGYFRQYLNPEGWQQETYPVNDFYTMPLSRLKDKEGRHLAVEVPFPGRMVKAYLWECQVGRNRLIFLDTNHPENSKEDRKITAQLYGGDIETRIQQEIILGIGGVRMLDLLGLEDVVLHSNDGHAAFLTLEKIRSLMKKHNATFAAAREAAMSRIIFTTHTPVPIGIDVFPAELMEKYFADYVKEVGISMEDLLRIGRVEERDGSAGFNMAVLAVRMSSATNAVSKLHRRTSRKMWAGLWPGVSEHEIPIGSVTNGIHIPSWISGDMAGLFDRYLGPRWREEPRDRVIWERVESIPMEELWRTHERRRERLVAFVRRSLHARMKARGVTGWKLQAMSEVLDPEALTVGFARRFAPYKRATLIFRDVDRLIKIVSAKDRPVQFLFAGKAHPRDQVGKELIRTIFVESRRPELASRVVFIEDYDLNVARYLVQGVDVWLNTPRPPKEASGTSGMKAVANGALHVSTKDGWWAEVDSEGLGWTIGDGEEYSDDLQDYGDEVESRALYDLLETEIVPLFYHRGRDGIPREWIKRMKRSMKELCPVFNSNRMVRQYTEQYYAPARVAYLALEADGLEKAAKLAEWKERVLSNWHRVKVVRVETDLPDETVVGATGKVMVWVSMAPLLPQDLNIEVVYGPIDSQFEIREMGAVPMRCEGMDETHVARFTGVLPCITSGKLGFAIRILPRNLDMANPYQMGLVKLVEA